MGDASHETVMPHHSGSCTTTVDSAAGEKVIALGVDLLTTLAALAANGLTRKGYQVEVKEESTFHAVERLVVWDDRSQRGAGEGYG